MRSLVCRRDTMLRLCHNWSSLCRSYLTWLLRKHHSASVSHPSDCPNFSLSDYFKSSSMCIDTRPKWWLFCLEVVSTNHHRPVWAHPCSSYFNQGPLPYIDTTIAELIKHVTDDRYFLEQIYAEQREPYFNLHSNNPSWLYNYISIQS